MTTAHDLTRIPEPYRARAVREAQEAGATAGETAWAQEAARAAVLARYLEIADEADAAVEKMRDEDPGQCSYPSAYLHVDESERETRAEVWRARMAEVEARPLIGIDPSRDVFTGTVDTEPRLDIHDDDGLRVAIAGVVRYLADRPAEALRAIAALVATLPARFPLLGLAGCDDRGAFDLVAALPGARTWSQPHEDGMLDVVTATIDGLDIRAGRRRPMTDEERAQEPR
jgi:hypothetical protein